jgi:glucose-1-phosphate cytidylyltransferase
LEKPIGGHAFINGGFFVVNKAVETWLEGDASVFELSALERLADEGRLAAFKHEGFWQCMDNIREVALLNELWKSGDAPWKTW